MFRFRSYCLPYSHRISNLCYSFSGKTDMIFPYRAVTFYGAPFQGTSGNQPVVRQNHISNTLLRWIRIDLYRFRSTLLAASIVLSFPAGTEMIHFPAFPFPQGNAVGQITHSGTCGSEAACAFPQIIAACCALLRLPSQSIHYMA